MKAGSVARTVNELLHTLTIAVLDRTAGPSTEAAKQQILAAIDTELERLQGQRRAVRCHQKRVTRAKLTKLSLPPAKQTELILRYETNIQKELYRVF